MCIRERRDLSRHMFVIRFYVHEYETAIRYGQHIEKEEGQTRVHTLNVLKQKTNER